MVLFLAFVRYQQNRRRKVLKGGFTFVERGLTLKRVLPGCVRTPSM